MNLLCRLSDFRLSAIMLSQNQIKFVNRLSNKKFRTQQGCFVVEGLKAVNEFLSESYELKFLFEKKELQNFVEHKHRVAVSNVEMEKLSAMKTAPEVIAVFKMRAPLRIDELGESDGLTMVLDDINDPGNFGTIIRLCDWYGVNNILCSKATVDCYNAKVVQSSMGSLARISILYTDVEQVLSKAKKPIFLTVLGGENLYKSKLPENGYLVMGNEANGIQEKLLNLKNTHKLSIPRFGEKKTESLNVAMATAIFLSEFKRSIQK